ncbi:tetratricopeptide repeat protein, partial [candidate division KSB1 bacterium]|nr:tetratricopeptide repeat protein [candidate division KSB1 bacterium]
MFRVKSQILIKLVLLILFFLIIRLLPAASQEQNNDSSTIHKIIDLIFREHYRLVEVKLDSLILTTPNKPDAYFYRGISYWRESNIQQNVQKFDTEMQKWLEKCLEICENRLNLNPDDPFACFYKGGAHGFLGTMHARQKNWLKTGYHAWKGIHALETALQLKPDFYDVHYGLGLYHVMAGNQGAIVRFLQRLLPIPTGDPEAGLSFLKSAIQRGVYSPLPASSALASAYLYFEKDYSAAIQIAESLLTIYPENLDLLSTQINALFNLEFSRPANQWGKLLDYIEQFEKVVYQRKLISSDWWSYKMKFMRGYAYYHQGKYDAALRLFEEYHAFYKEGSYLLGLGELTSGKIFDLMGKRQQAIKKYKNSRRQEKAGNVADLADYFLQNPFKKELNRNRIIATFTELPG